MKLSSWWKQHYRFILKILLKKSIQVTWLWSRPDIYSVKPLSASIPASIRIRNWEHAFSTGAGGSSANTRRMAAIRLVLLFLLFIHSWRENKGVGGHVGDVLDVGTNEIVQRVQVGGGGEPVKEGYKVVALLLKPSLGLFGLVGRRRVLLPHPGSATGHPIAPGDHHTLHQI